MSEINYEEEVKKCLKQCWLYKIKGLKLFIIAAYSRKSGSDTKGIAYGTTQKQAWENCYITLKQLNKL